MAAVAPEIRDDAKMFSPAALKKADEGIRKIYVDHDRDVLIETFASVPADDLEKVKAMDKTEKTEYFTRWAKARVTQRGVNGVYVLICKEPKFLNSNLPGWSVNINPMRSMALFCSGRHRSRVEGQTQQLITLEIALTGSPRGATAS